MTNQNLIASVNLLIEAAQAFLEGGENEGEELYEACKNFEWNWQEEDPDYRAYIERQADLFEARYGWDEVA